MPDQPPSPGGPWRKAQLSQTSGNCVQVTNLHGLIAIRDSKDPSGPVLLYTPAEWQAFLDGVKKGEFDDLGWPSMNRA